MWPASNPNLVELVAGSMYPDVVTCTEAEISITAGMPNFRSKQNIPGISELAQRKLKDMFQHSMGMASVLNCGSHEA